jgi:hypothetical protein
MEYGLETVQKGILPVHKNTASKPTEKLLYPFNKI